MAVTVRVTPSARNSHYAEMLRRHGAADAQRREYRAALRTAAKPMSDGVRADLGGYMPHRGGYLAVLGGALRARILPERTGVLIRNTAKGKARGRDLKSLERGRLRHPVFGRRSGRRGQGIMRDNRVRAHFFTEPITARADAAVRELVKVMREIAQRITS